MTWEGGFVVWAFDKAGYEEDNCYDDDARRTEYTHLLVENRESEGYHVVGVARGKPRFDLGIFRIVTEDVIFVLERDGWMEGGTEGSRK